MKIESMQVTPIAIADPPLLNAGGLHAPYALRLIVELATADNVSGFGEVPGHYKTEAALQSVRDAVVGAQPFDLNRILAAAEERLAGRESARGEQPRDRRQAVHVRSALEVALLDLQGKLTDQPVHALLGGKVRDRVEYAAYLFYKRAGAGGAWGFDKDPAATGWAAARQEAALDPEGIVRQAQAMCQAFGFRSIKLKGGAFPPREEVAAIKALRAAFGPAVPLRLDPNAIWHRDTALEVGRSLEGLLEYFEDPVRGQENMSVVRNALAMPLATNMCTTSFADLPESVAWRSEDVILSDHHFWGGLRDSLHLAAFCRAFDRGLSMHSNSHIGISLAAMTHLGAVMPNLTYACDTHYPWQSEDILTTGRIPFEDGAVRVSDEPGLGLDVDRQALQKLHAQYLACGLRARDDAAEMRKIDPNWTFKATRY